MDLQNEIIEGTFYEEELSPYTDKTKEYQIEKIIRKKKINGKSYSFIKWKGYENKFNAWEPTKYIHNL